MKYSVSIISAWLLLAVAACKQEQAPAVKTDSATPPAGKEAAKAPATIGDAADLKAVLQGKWKSTTESGTEYLVQGDQLERMANGTSAEKSQLTFSTSCAIGCGTINKKLGRAGSAGCLTLSGKENICFWVISYNPTQFTFVRMDKPDAQPEIWTKL